MQTLAYNYFVSGVGFTTNTLGPLESIHDCIEFLWPPHGTNMFNLTFMPLPQTAKTVLCTSDLAYRVNKLYSVVFAVVSDPKLY